MIGTGRVQKAKFARGLELNPHYAEMHNMLLHLLGYTGRFDECIAEARRAEELDPLGQRTSRAAGVALQPSLRSFSGRSGKSFCAKSRQNS